MIRNFRLNMVFKSFQNYMFGTLSSLTTVVINDSHLHTIYINEANIQTNLKTDEAFEDVQNTKSNELDEKLTNAWKDIQNNLNENSHDVEESFDRNDNDDLYDQADIKCGKYSQSSIKNNEVVKPERNPGNDTKVTKTNNKWAMKRALKNKKPKFKIVAVNEFDDTLIRRVQIDDNQLQNFITRERDSDRFKASRYKCVSCVKAFKSECLLAKHNNLWHCKVRIML